MAPALSLRGDGPVDVGSLSNGRRPLVGNEAFAGADGVVAVAHHDLDRVPLAVLWRGRGVAKKILLAQLVGDPRRRGVEIAIRHDDLGATAAVVGDRAQRVDVHALAEWLEDDFEGGGAEGGGAATTDGPLPGNGCGTGLVVPPDEDRFAACDE